MVVAEEDWFFFLRVGGGGGGIVEVGDGGVEGGFAVVDSGVLVADCVEGCGDLLVKFDSRQNGGLVLVFRVGVGVVGGAFGVGAVFLFY